jgi:hypothetical protein
MGREYTLFDLTDMVHYGYRVRRLITFVSGFGDALVVFFLCATAVRLSELSWGGNSGFRCRFISSTG